MFDAAHAFACSIVAAWSAVSDWPRSSVSTRRSSSHLRGRGDRDRRRQAVGPGETDDQLRFAGYDQVVSAGTNAKMPEVCAAMGLTGLESLDDFTA